LRNGLVVLSNTNLMKVGAAYGKGIYCSKDINVSMSYTHSYNY